MTSECSSSASLGDRDPGTDGHGLRNEIYLALDEEIADAVGRLEGHLAARREDEGELVAAEPVPAARHDFLDDLGEERESRIAGRMTVVVVDPLEMVDVDQAERDLTPSADGCESARCLVLERAAVLERREAVLRCFFLGRAAPYVGALVQGEGEDRRAEQQDEERGEPPEDDGLGGDEDHDREDRARVAEMVGERGSDAGLRREPDRDADERDVDDHERRAATEGQCDDRAVAVAHRDLAQECADPGRDPRGDRVRARVEGDLEGRYEVGGHGDCNTECSGQDRPFPAEEELGGDDEDEGERDVVVAGRVDRHGPKLGDQREAEEHRDAEERLQVGVGPGRFDDRPRDEWKSGGCSRQDVPAQPGRQQGALFEATRHEPRRLVLRRGALRPSVRRRRS